jgi:hypothetical protein
MYCTMRRIHTRKSERLRSFSWSGCDKYKVVCKSVSCIEFVASQVANITEAGDVILLSGFV